MESKERLKQRGGKGLAVPLADADSKKSSAPPPRRHKDSSSGGSPLMTVLLILAAAVAGAGGTYLYFTQVYLLEYDLHVLMPKQAEFDQKIEEEQARHRTLQSQVVTLNQEKSQLEQKAERIPQMEHRVDLLVKKKRKTNQAIASMSKHQLLQKYGPGPHYVEMNLQFDPNSNVAQNNNDQADDNDDNNDNDDSNKAKIILELASEDAMPHTVYWFLEQVERHMYDGTSFHRNAGHVVQAGPAPNFLSEEDAHLMKPFRESGMASVLFQEYSPEYPHVKYTVGYAGRPGGPDFYISMQDNTKNHGPGGQSSYEDAAEADPCFAKVVQGFEVADRIHQSAVKPGDYKHMEHNVAITSMRAVHFNPEKNIVEDEEAEIGDDAGDHDVDMF